jgi:N12 class adenine-specific DNA methylase
MEVTPDGSGFRLNNRFAQFINLPELMQIFGATADVKTREDINLSGAGDLYWKASGDRC